MEMSINSREYWQERFSNGSWEEYDGNKQSDFFASLFLDIMPEWLQTDLEQNKWNVSDYGCAQGGGTALLAKRFPKCHFIGVDFSEAAISYAKEHYPNCNFAEGNLTEEIPETDVVFSSNTLEHIVNPAEIMEKMIDASRKYTVLLLPFEDNYGFEEHFHYFNAHFFQDAYGSHFLSYYRVADCREKNIPYWPGKQLLLVYTNTAFRPIPQYRIADMYDATAAPFVEEAFRLLKQQKAIQEQLNTTKSEKHSAEVALEQAHMELAETQRQCNAAQEKLLEMETQHTSMAEGFLEEKQSMAESFLNEKTSLSDSLAVALQDLADLRLSSESVLQKLESVGQELEVARSEKTALEQNLNDALRRVIDSEKLGDRIQQRTIEAEKAEQKIREMQTQLDEYRQEVSLLRQNRQKVDSQVVEVTALCKDLVATKAFKLVHLISRIRHQLFRGTHEQRKNFWKWLFGRFQHKPDLNHNFNPMFSIIVPLQQVHRDLTMELCVNPLAQPMEISQNPVVQREILPQITAEVLEREYSKPDIIMFSVIDYDFRFQRPQHFAKRFAENGHRVFYINANFINPEGIKEISPNLYTVSFTTPSCNAIYFNDQWDGFQQWILEKMESLVDTYAIRDAIMVLDYPNWMDVSQALHDRYGFARVADYMDDATGFLGTTTKSLKQNCERMLRDCDLVVPSSQFLADIARKYTDKITLIRNGTEVEHVQRVLEMEQHRQRPVIGYYGAVSHWFDWEKVCYVAKNLPQCEVVIIGAVTEYRDKLEGYENIKLLGEKDYQELPEHLAYFDVCLIPFETSNDLIKATNPVKFYEYLSAGKRVVATEIPELEPYRDRYVYMSNDNQQFLEYIKLCLNGEDALASKEDCVAFAKNNDWQSRYEAFSQACVKSVPKVSVIVLTYNNLKLNRYCIDSILKNTAYPNYELIILDNRSTDGTVEYLRELDARKDPRVRVVLNPENSGFAGGNNKAIQISDGKYVVLLNNDTVVTRGWLTALVKHMEADPKCGMVGAVTNSIGNEQMIAVQYRNLKELSAFAYAYTRQHMGEKYCDIDRVPLFCTMIRKDMMEQHGLLDDGYRVGMFEDDDYAMLVKKAGYHFFAAEDCFIHHVNNASFKKLHPQEYKKIFDENRARFEQKWNTAWKMPKYRAEVTADVNEGCMVEPVE